MLDETSTPLQLSKRLAPTLIGFALGCLVFLPRLASHDHSLGWLLLHGLCGPLEKPVYDPSTGITHTDVFFTAVLLFMAGSHVFSMRRAPAILSFLGAFLWVAAAVGHYR
jgi:hypothetical protein